MDQRTDFGGRDPGDVRPSGRDPLGQLLDEPFGMQLCTSSRLEEVQRSPFRL